jgi:serine/threonine protein kinase
VSRSEHQAEPGAQAELDALRRTLDREYDIKEELGRGGMAVVYLARDRQLDREVALKVLPPRLMHDSAFVERFQREGRIAAQLEHPHIVPIYRVGREGDVIYFAMKHLRGGSLAALLKRQGRLSPGEVRRILLEVGDALECAGSHLIVHRDIKPENILFDETGRCVVTDFGIAKSAAETHLTGTGQSIGTPHYMSPEQARGIGIDIRSDLYSLGVVAYYCLAGKVPFDGSDNMAILYAHVNKTLPTPALPTPEHATVYRIVQRLVMKNPADRIQSGRELIASLQAEPSPLGSGTTLPTHPVVSPLSHAMATLVSAVRVLLGRCRDLWLLGKRRPRGMAITGATVAMALMVAYAGGSTGSSQSLCPQASPTGTSGQPEFLLLMDPVPHQAKGPTLKISYDVCGLPSGTPYRASLRLYKREDFLKKVFGDKSKPIAVTFQDQVDGAATRRSRNFALGTAQPGAYSLELSIRDNRGRERRRVQSLTVIPD